MPTLSTHVPEDWEFAARFNSRISAKEYRGKPGPYLRDLLESDLSAGPQGSQLGFTARQIDRWMDDEVALLQAGQIARKALSASTPASERQQLLTALAENILDAAFRKPIRTDALPMAGERPIDYGSTPRADQDEARRSAEVVASGTGSFAAGKSAATRLRKTLPAKTPTGPAKVGAEHR